MILKRAHIKNFRSLRDVTVSFERQTAILGGNGAGKSTILKALEKFYGASGSASLDDFFGKNTDEPIEIALTFTELSDAERDIFDSRIINHELNVLRVFDVRNQRISGRYYGFVRGHTPFHAIRSAERAREKQAAYKALRDRNPQLYSELTNVSRADEIEEQLTQWEKAHTEKCQVVRDDGQFLGFTNVAKGSLSKSTSFVFIPAVRDAAADAVDGRGSPIARLMELVVKNAVQQRQDFQKWQEKTSAEYRQLVSPDNLTELRGLADDLTSSLRILYDDAAVSLEWQPAANFAVPLPAADVSLEDGGFPSSVERQGNGLQRAFILTLLQHLARATVLHSVYPEPDGESEDGETSGGILPEVQGVPEIPALIPGLILAIEEPELYQHPTKQRHLARVLSRLSDGSLPGVANKMQIAFASHSPHFVSVDHFDEVRLARRYPLADVKHKECRLRESSLTAVCRLLEHAHEKPEGTFKEAGLRSRLHIITPEVAEGFFADVVVLVEGESDRAALKAAASIDGIDLEAKGIAVVAVNGKNNLDRPAAIFISLEIPVYVVWDSDKSNGKIDGESTNRSLQRLLGTKPSEIVSAGTIVTGAYASFEWKLEKTLEAEFGEKELENALSKAMGRFSVNRKEDAIKSPAIMKDTLAMLAEDGKRSGSLRLIVKSICDLKAKTLVIAQEGNEAN